MLLCAFEDNIKKSLYQLVCTVWVKSVTLWARWRKSWSPCSPFLSSISREGLTQDTSWSYPVIYHCSFLQLCATHRYTLFLNMAVSEFSKKSWKRGAKIRFLKWAQMGRVGILKDFWALRVAHDLDFRVPLPDIRLGLNANHLINTVFR